MQRKEGVYMIPKNLPILFAAGSEDPVGNFGKGVRKIYEKYRAAGIRDVSLQLYTRRPSRDFKRIRPGTGI